MTDRAREFGLFIDGLRLERDISREDLCDNIMSLSQYKRYLRGDTSIPNNRLVQIAERLKFSINDIHFLFGKKHNDEYYKIYEIYRLIKINEFKKAFDLSQIVKNDIIVSEYNILFLDFCLLRVQHALKMVSDIHVLELYSRLINFPNCADNDSFNMVEISVLIQIVTISSNMGNLEPTNVMYRILASKSFTYSNSGDSSFLPSIYSSLSSILGVQEQHEKVLELSQKGIDYCISQETSNALAHLFLFNSLGHLYTGNREAALLSVKKCFMQLFIEDKPEKLKAFNATFENQFKMKLEDLIDFKK